MKKIFEKLKIGHKSHISAKNVIVFRDLNKEDRAKYLQKGASEFSKKFSEVIIRLANE